MRKFTFFKSFVFSFLLMLIFSTKIQAQSCCSAMNFNDFKVYCISNYNHCDVNTTCTGAALDAAYGITGNWNIFECAAAADCSGGNSGGGPCDNTHDAAPAALPVELIELGVEYNANDVDIYWSTASEINNKGFEVQRSIDGKNWSVLGFVDGMGDSQEISEYRFTDENPNIGFNYYRLKQMDLDETFEYSGVKVMIWQGNNDAEKLELAVLPNPASEWITAALPLELDRESNLQFDIYNQMGAIVKTVTLNETEEIRISLDGLSAGLYILSVSDGKVKYTSRFIKN